MDKISIIIPAYNEEKRIGNTLESYSNYFEKLRKHKKIDYGMLVVINNTQDNTEKIVKSVSKKNKRVKYLNFKRGGKGFAITEGFKASLKEDYNLMGFVDADMSTNPSAFYDLILKIGKCEGVIASRYLKQSVVNPKPSLKRIIVSRIFNALIRSLLFLPYRDTQCGAKVFKRVVIEKTISQITFSRWAYDVDLLYHVRKNKFKIREIPTSWSDKEHSKINFISAGPWMALGVIRLRLINSPFKFLIRIYDKIISKIYLIK